MRILVAVKRVADYAAKIRVKPDGSGIDLSHIKMGLNPFCEIALEEALRLKAATSAGATSADADVAVVAVGPTTWQDAIRQALAMGADRGCHVVVEGGGKGGGEGEMEPLGVAKILKAVAERERPELMILGKQGIDGDHGQTGQMLAGLLGWAQGTFASKVVVDRERGTCDVTREVDGGLETLRLKMPAVITADLRLNEPRYATLPNIMKAKKKQILKLSLEDLGIDLNPKLKTLKIVEPKKREGGKIVQSVDELLDKLKNEARVL